MKGNSVCVCLCVTWVYGRDRNPPYASERIPGGSESSQHGSAKTEKFISELFYPNVYISASQIYISGI